MVGGDVTEEAELRGRVYGFLRRVFEQEVDAALLDWCRLPQQLELWKALGLDLDEILLREDTQAALEDLAVEYCRLFITSGTDGSPHESLHLGGSGAPGTPLLFGDPASAVKQLYREAGFELPEEAGRLADALGVELEFMERLCEREAKAAAGGEADRLGRVRAMEGRMLKGHIARWIPEYCRKMASYTQDPFYGEMFHLLEHFVESETLDHA